MSPHRNVLINFLGGAWGGLLIVLTTPWFIRWLGLEGFGLIGFWQVLFYLSLIFDLGFGSALARELARNHGDGTAGGQCRGLLALFERPVLALAVVMAVGIGIGSDWMARSWLSMQAHDPADITLAIRLMAASIPLQFLSAFYANGLAGLQRMGRMNAILAFNNAMKYLGGLVVAGVWGDVVVFFAFQAVAALIGAIVSRWALSAAMPGQTSVMPSPGSLRPYLKFSGGMFFTAACGALLANADRLAVSRLMPGDALGKYSVAITAIGLLQMFVFAFHRAYYPKFAELHAAGQHEKLKQVYLDGCALVSTLIVPMGLTFTCFTPELFMIWLGWTDPALVTVSRLLVLGFIMSGVMWLPAAYQQAMGRTRLHATLMAATLAAGIPLLVVMIGHFGLPGAAALMLGHGVVQITLGLWLMNRALFPGENVVWYRRVIVRPILMTGPVILISMWLLPSGLSRVALALWISATLGLAYTPVLIGRWRQTRSGI